MTARSTNGGENWEVPSTFVSKKNWKSVIFSNGKFIAVSIDGYVTTSTDGLNSVSYTHLDVYKRQEVVCRSKMQFEICIFIRSVYFPL